MDTRIIKKDNRYFPQYYSNGIFGLFKGWRFYESDELWLNGIYTDITKCDLSFVKLKDARKYLKDLYKEPRVIS